MSFFREKILHTFIFIGLLLVFVLPNLSLAQLSIEPCEDGGSICNPISSQSVGELIKKILEGIVKIGMPIVALAIIYSGFLFVFAQGNSEKLKEAKSAFLFSVIGAAVLLGSWALAQLISETVSQL